SIMQDRIGKLMRFGPIEELRVRQGRERSLVQTIERLIHQAGGRPRGRNGGRRRHHPWWDRLGAPLGNGRRFRRAKLRYLVIADRVGGAVSPSIALPPFVTAYRFRRTVFASE